jgi:hypothetical protein
MANHTGNDGVVKVGGSTVAETRSWALDISIGTVDDTVIRDTWETHQVVQKNWSAQLEVFWDETDTAQIALTVGASVTLALYPEGADSGDSYYTGTATVEKLALKGTHNGMVESSLSLKGNGALTGPSTV